MSQTTLAALKNEIQPPVPNIAMSMETVAGFESMQRIAKLFSTSSIAPKAYQGNVADCFIAVDMAMRMGANPLMVMQNLYIVHGSPAWSAQFLIATFNRCGRFSALRYEFQGKEGSDDWGCRAVTTELATKEKLVGPLVTIGLAKKEGWHGKPGSKWQTMPEQMLRYRAAAWLVRAYAPEIAMGLHTVEEIRDKTITVEAVSDVAEEAVTLDTIAEEAAQTQETRENKRKPKKSSPEADANVEPEDQKGQTEAKARQPERQNAEAGPAAWQEEKTYLCPKSERTVTDDDCFTCRDKSGCPARA